MSWICAQHRAAKLLTLVLLKLIFSLPHLIDCLLAALMKNTGILIANDSNSDRCKAIAGNFHRMGINNAVVSTQDGRTLPQVGFSKAHEYHE